jgi:hypothetical protein
MQRIAYGFEAVASTSVATAATLETANRDLEATRGSTEELLIASSVPGKRALLFDKRPIHALG